MSKGSGIGCAKGGCFGCLGVVALGMTVSLAIGGLQLMASRRPVELVSDVKSSSLPPLSLATLSQLEDAAGEIVPTETLESIVRPLRSGTLALDLSMGEFFIVPGEVGSEIEVEAEYDKTRFRLEEEYEEDDDGNWTYSVRLRPALRFMGFGDPKNRVEIRVPRGRPLAIVGKLRMGRSEIELGGLWIEELDLEVGMGEHFVTVSEPTAAPMELFRLTGQMGAVRVSELGNASPKRIEVRHRMGELRLGLEGAWEEDSVLSMRCQMGECNIGAPKDVLLVVERVSVLMGGKSIRLPDPDSVPEGAPTIRLDLRGSMGEIRVR